MGRPKKLNCVRCGALKTIDNCTLRKDGFFESACRECRKQISFERRHKDIDKYNEKQRELYWAKRNADPYYIAIDDRKARQVKVCILCKEEKSIVIDENGFCEDFYVEKGNKTSSRCKECVQIYLNNWKKEKGYKARKRLEKLRIIDPIKYLWIHARNRAKRDNLEFNIAISDIEIPQNWICPVLGIQMMIGGGKYNAPSLDRIDNTKGYVIGNVLIISYRANSLKRDSSPEERQQLVDFYSNIEASKEKIKNMELIRFIPIENNWFNIKNDIERNKLRREEYKSNVLYHMLKAAKARAKKANIKYNITESDILFTTHCPIYGIKFEISSGDIDNSPSLERIDPFKGYVKNNVIVICYKANRSKGDSTLNEMKLINNFYKNLNKKPPE